MKLRYKFTIQKLGSKYAAITVDEDAAKFNGMLKVNETGMKILQALSRDIEKTDILDLLKDDFDNPDEMNSQLDTFLDQLYKAGLLI